MFKNLKKQLRYLVNTIHQRDNFPNVDSLRKHIQVCEIFAVFEMHTYFLCKIIQNLENIQTWI